MILSGVYNHKRAYHRKKYKLESQLDSISITSEMEDAAAIFSPTFLTENVVVFDGSVDSSTVVAPNTSVPGWKRFSVVDGPATLLLLAPPSNDTVDFYPPPFGVLPVQCSSKQTDSTFIHEEVESIGAISDPACAGKSFATYPQAQSLEIFTSKKKQRNPKKSGSILPSL